MMLRLFAKASISLCAIGTLLTAKEVRSATTDHEDHASWEVAKVYDLAGDDMYAMTVSPAEGEDTFDDDHVAFMVVPTASTDDEGLHEAEELAETAWEAYAEGGMSTELHDGEAADPSATVVYQAHLESVPTVVSINIVDEGAYALLFEKGDEEAMFVLSSSDGSDIEAAAESHGEEHGEDEHGHDEHDDHDDHEDHEDEEEEYEVTSTIWGYAIAASIVVSLCSLVGIVFTSSATAARWIDLSHASMLAAGALLATAFLHIVPEGIESLNADLKDLHLAGNRGGIAVLVGLTIGIAIHAIMAAGPNANDEESRSGEDIHKSLKTMMDYARSRKLFDISGLDPICWNVVLGDFVHNFGDGILIGTAFLACDASLGWIITASTVLHELPHEVADFLALLRGGTSLAQAYMFNFLSALSAILGVILILALEGEMTSAQSAFILLIGGGSFIFISLAELIPEALVVREGESPTLGLRCKKVLSFLVGAILIAIPLMWDRHCEAAHDHDHGH